MSRIAVIGGGINGVMTAWELAAAGHRVDLLERDRLMSGTSSASTKLLHGGLRYLEHGQFSLVREGLRERTWWIRQAPHLAHPLPIALPIYRTSRRGFWTIKLGLTLYDGLAGRLGLGKHRRVARDELLGLMPELRSEGLLGGFLFHDGQMDDHALGLWAADKARQAGVTVWENVAADRVTTKGDVTVNGATQRYDTVYNIAGPWAGQLLAQSGIESDIQLSLVKGSHLVLDFPVSHGAILEVPGESRVVFILPYKGHTLVGTTEVAQTLDDPIECSAEEERYLLDVCNRHLKGELTPGNITDRFAGLRPLVRTTQEVTGTSREYAFERRDRLVTVFGGKWTTAHALAKRAAAV